MNFWLVGTATAYFFVFATDSATHGFVYPIQRAFVTSKQHLANTADDWKDSVSFDSNEWISTDDSMSTRAAAEEGRDWEDILNAKKDGSYWSTFEPLREGDDLAEQQLPPKSALPDEDAVAESWLDTLQSLTAEEVEFNLKEADRADKVRQMLEWGFDAETIKNTLGVATDTSLEVVNDMKGMQKYREQAFLDQVDLERVESHTTVEVDDLTGEPVRTQMVYVDEHTCIGCTNCAMIAQSTFFMHSEHGRARVFQQWGDDDETIQVAIETCPVDCIHYVPFDELKDLEVDRRNQNINFKARLVSQAEYGNGLSHMSGGGPNAFTMPQKISGNLGARCANCPTRGCPKCPMYGVGKNPAFEKREAERKALIAKRKLQQKRESALKKAEL